MSSRKDPVHQSGLHIDPLLHAFVNDEVLPPLGLAPEGIWQALADIVQRFTPRNRALLAHRDWLQRRIDDWHLRHAPDDPGYEAFLREIGYLAPEVPDFRITTHGVDPEIAHIAAPQLVVPLDNARYAINAANARWGSLYDALYGSDMLPETPARQGAGIDPERADAVVAWTADFLDRHLPLRGASHREITAWQVRDGRLVAHSAQGEHALVTPEAFRGWRGAPASPEVVLLRHHGLHVELCFDPRHPVGQRHPAGLCDVQLEAAVTVIQDCEDSVAAVDGEDKTRLYRNWLGLMRGDLTLEMEKSGRRFTRRLAEDRHYHTPDGGELRLKGRALMLIRNVGHLMTTPAVRDTEGQEVFEGLLDAFVTSLITLHDLNGLGRWHNSETGSVYIVKPKMHGPEEVAFTCDLFAAVEDALALPRHTLKLGLMDEERRTTLNLEACIHAARERLIFINTGFLDRTGDEIHTDRLAGPVVRKADMKRQTWIDAYEDWNVDIGLACGLAGRAQIGKGMWAMPDAMAAMMEQKIAHPRAGANTAWVPSPTAAVLHATHYHAVDVHAEQARIAERPRRRLAELLTGQLADPANWSPEQIREELENNCQGILGYVVRWIDQGIGCSKVPDIHDVALMEDRATLRISSQHIVNWLTHGIVSEREVLLALRRMAQVVDQQNRHDPAYRPMAPAYDGPAFEAACQLIFHGRELPNGYTEPVLHPLRRNAKEPTSMGSE